MVEHMFATPLATVPAHLSELPPGPALAAALADMDLGRLYGHDRVGVLQAHERLASHYAAMASADMAAIHDQMVVEWSDDPETSFKAAAAEIRLALRLTRHASIMRLQLALELQQRLPAVWDAWVAGRIDERRVDIIATATSHLDPDVARGVVDLVVDEAHRLTTGELRRRLRELCVIADPDDTARRYDQAVAERRVVNQSTVAGTADLSGFDLPPHEAAAAMRYVQRMARSLKRAGDPRPMDQLRADVFTDLLQGRTPGGGAGPDRARGLVELRVDLTTLAELDDRPGDLGGYGPVIADVARQVADTQPDAEWRYVVCHPDSGQPIHVGTTRRRPTAHQRRQIEARSPRCVFPGCQQPAGDCHIDHRAEWAATGVTCTGCAEPLCPGDHGIRHLPGWMYQLQPDGDHLWTTRLGHRYTTSGRSP